MVEKKEWSFFDLSKAVDGLKTRDLKKIFRVKDSPEFNREILRANSLLGSFGLTLHYVSSIDKWFLGAITEDHPKDLSETSFKMIGMIYKLKLEGNVLIDSRDIELEFKLPKKIIEKSLTELQEKNYISIRDGEIEFTEKTKKSIIIRGF